MLAEKEAAENAQKAAEKATAEKQKVGESLRMSPIPGHANAL